MSKLWLIWTKCPEPSALGSGIGTPDVVASEPDMGPSKRWQMARQILWYGGAVSLQRLNGTIEIDGVRQHDRRDGEIQAAGAVALVIIVAIAYFPKTVEEGYAGERVS